ncbi:MAG: iron-containing alcohol dehydrogenase [Pseudomonadota bacterium]
MTLITLHSRIHFASNILEEALRAEVDEKRHANAVLLCLARQEPGELLARVEEGLMSCPRVRRHVIAPEHSRSDTAEAVLAYEAEHALDLIVAFGTAEAIAHGRTCRHAIGARRYGARRFMAGDNVRQHQLQPDFFVIPGLGGLPDPCLESNASVSFKTMPPSVIVCDPTVIGRAEEVELARALTLAMGRCLSVLTAETFNPLADGLAIDALTRLCRIQLGTPAGIGTGRDQRDLMAATLNAAIALQKGPGLVETFGFSFGKSVGRDIDGAVLHRVLLARMLASTKLSNAEVIGRVLGLPAHMALPDFVDHMLQSLPLPHSLRDMNIAWDEVEQTMRFMTQRFGTPQVGSSAELRQVLRDVF